MTMIRAHIAAGGGSGDITEDSINWANISGETGGSNAAQTFDEIDSPIEISWSLSGTSGVVVLTGNGSTGPTLAVNPGDSVSFAATTISGGSTTVTVRNVTDGNALLDTFTVSLTG